MFDGSMFDVDKFVHAFVRSLGLRMKSPACKNFGKINFMAYIDDARRLEQQLLYTLDKVRDINMQQNLDFSSQESVRYFIERHASFFDKFNSFSNTRIMTSHLKNINTKILQKVRARRKSMESIKKMEPKLSSKSLPRRRNLRTNLGNKSHESKKSLSSTTCREKHAALHNYKKSKCKKASAPEACKLSRNDARTPNSREDVEASNANGRDGKARGEPNLPSDITSVVDKEVEISKKILRLCTERIKCIKRNIEITLHIAKKECYNDGRKDQTNYNETLCRHAILCLIEPSEKASVLFEDSLSAVVQRYVSQGYKCHFEFQRDSQGRYAALLILSPWARVFVKHIDTTMMRTIGGVLGCDVENILVLHSPEENL